MAAKLLRGGLNPLQIRPMVWKGSLGTRLPPPQTREQRYEENRPRRERGNWMLRRPHQEFSCANQTDGDKDRIPHHRDVTRGEPTRRHKCHRRRPEHHKKPSKYECPAAEK